MHPLLVSAVASTAGNFLDRWARGAGAPAATPAAPDFQTLLDGRAATRTPAQLAAERIARLRDELLGAPEIRSVLDAADPAHPAKISLTPDGRVLCATPGRDARPLQLSPDSAAIARELATLTASPASHAVSAQSAPGQAARDVRAAAFDLTPPAGIAALR